MRQGDYVFDVPTLANGIGVTTTDLSNQLQNLKVLTLKMRPCFKNSLAIGVKNKNK